MSYSKHQPSKYTTPRAQDNQLINSLYNNHDLQCGCDNANSHLTYLLIKNTQPTQFNKEEKKEIEKWLGTIMDTTEEDTVDTGIDAGDLEALFAEEDTSNDG